MQILFAGLIAARGTAFCLGATNALPNPAPPAPEQRPTPVLRMLNPYFSSFAETNSLPPPPTSPTNAIPPRPETNKQPPVAVPAPPSAPPPAPGADGFPRPARGTLEAQVALARLEICPGSIDGVKGSQTAAALRAFQRRERLPETGELDAATAERLWLDRPALTNYTITAGDLARLGKVPTTWLGKSRAAALDYENALELAAERGQANPRLLERLNPGTRWNAVQPGERVILPDVARPGPGGKAAFLVIRLAEKYLEAFDAGTNLLAHFPCSIARRVEKRPLGELRVRVIIPNPDYTFNPAVFPESAEGRALGRRLVLPPGPNNPVGVAWMGLDRPGYGIHGTPSPEQVGRTESHGCFRLANWNAAALAGLVEPGLPVWVVQ